ncbi:hypothetical protein AMATHDRAFT_72516 [Amanita thiersii Skay4041]|uniref:Fibronectin type-III domain-containing protein n=1 Tax=Amanita thiersii Skay4041 TaxID=703135 RepID=A0A2A9P1N8_9AGAR|nr:hypothetical protein AMATHDRAFT_72516 [Amanita thiersii Skay4041]
MSRLSFLLPTLSFLSIISASTVPFIEQSFYFDYYRSGEVLPVPVTTQCEVIHIKWQRGIATGPNPVAPYFLLVYTSNYVFPFTIPAGNGLQFDWAVPFAPGTQYQICMFDSRGGTGGCQAIYTVIPSTGSNASSCSNVTFPLGPLDVNAEVSNGPLSQYGWIDQCTDIAVTPRNGTPPYYFTVAPTLHPPYNITSQDARTMNWTVGLSWASPFFISVIDSDGNSWSNGPLHSGGFGPTKCLAASPSGGEVSPGIAIGAGVGGLAVGLFVGLVSSYLFLRRRRKGYREPLLQFSSRSNSPAAHATFDNPTTGMNSQYAVVPTAQSHASSNPSSGIGSTHLLQQLSQGPAHYQIEPFVMPVTEDGRLESVNSHPVSPVRPLSEAPTSSGGEQVSPPSQVYVVHHDGGRPPVTVYHQDGTQVIELPPVYDEGTSAHSTSPEGSVAILQPRRPIQIRKRTGSNPTIRQPL